MLKDFLDESIREDIDTPLESHLITIVETNEINEEDEEESTNNTQSVMDNDSNI